MYLEVAHRGEVAVAFTLVCHLIYEQEDDEDKLNHRIPHRFEPITNIGTNWCCHCGYMLPLGRKNARKCSECDITCHANCAHLVPDFCGMSMETANQLLAEMQKVRASKTSSKARQAPPRKSTMSPTMEQPSPPGRMGGYPPQIEEAPPMDILAMGMESVRLSQEEQYRPPSQSPVQGRYSPDLRYQQQQQQPIQSYGQIPDVASPVARPPRGARPPDAPIPYPDLPSGGRVPQGYDQGPPTQDPYAMPPYQVSDYTL